MRTRSQSRHNSPQQEASPVIVEPLRIELSFLEDQFQEDPPPEVPMAYNRTMAELLQAPHKVGFIELCCGWKFLIQNASRKLENNREQVQSSSITSSSTLAVSSEVVELKDLVRALLLDKKNQSSAPVSSSTPAPVKAVEPNCVTCGGSGSLPSNTITNPKEELKGITTRSGIAYQGPTIPTPSKVVKQGTEVTKDQVQTPSSQSTAPIQPLVSKSETLTLISDPVVAPVSASMPNVKSSIFYPSRRDNERRHDQANEQIKKFYEIFKDMSFEISFTDALILMPKFASTLKALTRNKEKLSKIARTPMNEHCSVVILNKLPRKLGDPGKFLIPCEFPGMDECLALADLGASINLMPLSVWEALSLPELTSTCMTLKLADRSVSKPIGIAKDVSFKVGVFHFPAVFVVVDFEPDLRVPLILGRCFLKTGRALIDVHMGELTLRIRNKAITYNLNQIVRYSANYNQMMANKIDVLKIACKEYSQEVLGFSDVTTSGNPTPHDDPIISTTSPTLTPFEDNDLLLFEEADAFLAILNSEPLPPLPNHEQYLPSFKKELKVCEAKTVKSFVDEPLEVKLKDLPPHLEYAFLKGNNKFPIIIAKELGDEEKSTLIKVLKSHKRAIAWKLSDIQGGFTVVENEENELILTRLVTEWRVCIDYRKLNEAIRKDHFTLPFMDQMLERLAGNEFYCFLDGFSGYFQIPIDPHDQEKTTFTCPYETFAYRRMPFGLCNAPGTFQRCMLAIFHDMDEKTMEVFLDDFSVFGNSFENCLSRLDKMLQRIEVDRAKFDVIAKLPHPTTVKGVRSFLGCKGEIALWVLLLQEFNFKVLDTKGVENLAADHLSRLENPYENVLDLKGINETFPLETLSMVTFRGDSSASWFADFANYHAGNFIVKDTNLSLNWEKSHFMVKEGIVLGHKISKNGIEVDRDKVDMIAKLPHPTTVKGYFQIPVDPRDQEKTTFTCPYGTSAYRRMPFDLCNAPGTFQRCFGDSFENCLSRLDKMLQRCEDTNLCLNWEKSHFMVKEGIVLGHKISKNGIEVDKAKVDVIDKFPHPTTIKGVRSFLGHAGFYRRFIQDFSKISRLMIHLLEKNTPFIFSEDCIKAFQTLKKKLTEAPILISPNWDLLFELMCDASDFAIGAVLGQRHEKHFRPIHYASKTMNDASGEPSGRPSVPKGINETFPLETLSMVSFRGDSSTPWFADFANYHASNFIVKELKACEAKTVKSSVDEPPEVELKDLPPHLEYVFLEGDNKLPVIIAKELGDVEKSALIKVLKSYKRAIAWKLSDIQGFNLEFYTHKILM
nr:reverse transcriptase domain-containing protein [Tanacetum cinerariifolium]